MSASTGVEAGGRNVSVLEGLAVVAAVLVVAGHAGPWYSSVPFHVFEEPEPEVTHGFEEAGPLFLVPVLGSAAAFWRSKPRWAGLVVAGSHAACGLLLAWYAASVGLGGFLAETVSYHWGLAVTVAGWVLGFLSGVGIATLGWRSRADPAASP